MSVLDGLAVNHSTWDSVGPNVLIDFLIDLRWEEFIAGSFWASWWCLELENMFQPDFYTWLLLLRGKLLGMKFTKKISPAIEWGSLTYREKYTLAFDPKAGITRGWRNTCFQNCPITLVTITAPELFLVHFVFSTEYIAPVSTRKSICLFPTVSCTWGYCG